MACEGMFSQKIVKVFFKFILLHLSFSCYYCSIDPKRQSENSGLVLCVLSLKPEKRPAKIVFAFPLQH